MHVTLIYLSVIMILSFVVCSGLDDIKDITDWCSNDRVISYYLTSGAGSSDKSVIMIASDEIVNCSVKFSVKSENNVLVVLEYPDMMDGEKVCYSDKNTSVTVSDYSQNEPCQSVDMKMPFRRFSKDTMSVNFRNGGNMTTVKITATSMRDANRKKCVENSEVECIVDDKMFCMTTKTLCDGNNNCGVPGSFDEDVKHCKEPKPTLLMILCSVIMVLLTIFLLMSISMCLVPVRKEPYVNQFDETMSLFDCEKGIISLEINVMVLFPSKKPVSHRSD